MDNLSKILVVFIVTILIAIFMFLSSKKVYKLKFFSGSRIRELLRIIIIVGINCLFLLCWFDAIKYIWSLKNIAWGHTLKTITIGYIQKILPFTPEMILEKPTLNIEIKSIDGYIINILEENSINDELMKGKKQYEIIIINKNKSDIDNAELNFQFPFLVENIKIDGYEKSTLPCIEPVGTDWKVKGGSINVFGKFRTWHYKLMVNKIQPSGRIIILVLLDSMSRRISEGARIKDIKAEYIIGEYIYNKNKFDIFCPIEVKDDGSIYFREPSDQIPPHHDVIGFD